MKSSSPILRLARTSITGPGAPEESWFSFVNMSVLNSTFSVTSRITTCKSQNCKSQIASPKIAVVKIWHFLV